MNAPRAMPLLSILALTLTTACTQPAAERVSVPPPNDASSYRPVPQEKPLPPSAGGPDLQQQQPAPPPSAPGEPPPPATPQPHPGY